MIKFAFFMVYFMNLSRILFVIFLVILFGWLDKVERSGRG